MIRQTHVLDTFAVTCDECGRRAGVQGSTTSKRALELLSERGWNTAGRRDLCPRCVKSGAVSTPRGRRGKR